MVLQWDGYMTEGRKGIHYVLPQPIDLNSASVEQLMLVRGIGLNYAKRIIEQRPYHSIDALVTKARIPNYVLERIRDQFTLGQPSHNTIRNMRYEESTNC